jgi:prophage regulatory protein
MTTLHHTAATVGQPTSSTTTITQPLRLELFRQTTSAVSLYRLKQVLARIPISRSACFAGIKTGRYPHGYSLGPRTTVWKSTDIDAVIASLSTWANLGSEASCNMLASGGR